jgi:uncharacterized RDD family membrane protein YckC
VTSPAGWHPDPQQPPGQLPQLRYWDGTRWTEHTSPAPAVQPAYATTKSTTTPDGMPLAGWWHRVGAYLLDGLVLLVIGMALALPWVREVFDAYGDFFDEAFDDATSGRQTDTDMSDLQRDVAGPMAVIALIQLVVGFVYHVGFLMWLQATPGKLLTGLRVRLREAPGPMPLGTVLLRWFGQSGGVGLVSLVPYVGSTAGLYGLLDHLWPLWDDNKQAIHDKVAKTNVVRVR